MLFLMEVLIIYFHWLLIVQAFDVLILIWHQSDIVLVELCIAQFMNKLQLLALS